MKRTFGRAISLVLAAVILFGLPMTTLQASALTTLQLDEYTGTDYEKEDYNPEADGFYGYLSVRMENEDCTGFNERSLPVLVKNGHVLVSAEQFATLSSRIGYSGGGYSARSFSVYNKTVVLGKDSTAYFIQGSIRRTYTMSTSCVLQDEELWIPLQDVCTLLGMEYHDLVAGFLTISEPEEDIIDTYIDIMESDTGCFDFREAYMSDNAEENAKIQKAFDDMGVSSHVMDNLDGMLRLELDKWVDTALELVTLGMAESTVTDPAYMKSVVEDVLKTSTDEFSFMSAESTAYGIEFADLFESIGDSLAEAASKSYLLKADEWIQLESRLESALKIKLDSRFSKTFTSAAEKCTTISDFCSTADDVMDAAGYVIDAYALVRDISNQDKLAQEGMTTVLNIVSKRSSRAMSDDALAAAESAVSAYSGEGGSALAYWAGRNIDSVVSTVIHAAAGAATIPLDVYDLLSGFFPFDYAENLNAAESFREALIAMQLEEDTRSALLGRYSDTFDDARDFANADRLEDDLSALYARLKVRYVTRCLGMEAMNKMKDSTVYADQKALLEQDGKWMSVLASYTDGGFIDPTEMQEALSACSDFAFCDYVTPAYIRVYGTITDGATGEELENAELEIILENENIDFKRTEGGEYEFYLPLAYYESLCDESSPDIVSRLGELVIKAKHEDYEKDVEVKSSEYKAVGFGSGSIPAMQYEIKMDIMFGNNYLDQIDLIVAHYSTWQYANGSDGYSTYRITDLDRDGYLEITTNTMQGTGLFTYSSSWEVNEDITDLVKLSLDGNYMPDYYTWFDENDEGTYLGWYDEESGISYYVTCDDFRDSYYDNYTIYYECWMDGTTIYSERLGYRHESTSMSGGGTTTTWVVGDTDVNSADDLYAGCRARFDGMESFEYGIVNVSASAVSAETTLRDLLIMSAEGFLLRDIDNSDSENQ